MRNSKNIYRSKSLFLPVVLAVFFVFASYPLSALAGTVPQGEICSTNTDCLGWPPIGCWGVGTYSVCGTEVVSISSFSASPTTVNAGQTVDFSVEYGGGIAQTSIGAKYWFVWNFNDGSVVETTNSPNAGSVGNSHVFNTPGNYNVTLTVWYGSASGVGQSVSRSVVVSVNPLPNNASCSVGTQCASGNCASGICQPPGFCTDDTDCLSGYYCNLTDPNNGFCAENPNTTIDLCPNVNGNQTTTPCADTQCASGSVWHFSTQSCVPSGGGSNLCENVSCSGGQTCNQATGQCVGGGGAPGTSETTGFINPLEDDTIYAFLARALRVLVDLLIPIIVLFYVIAGLMFITARGNPAKLTLAKQAFLYTTIGAAVILGAWVLAEMIKDTIDVVQATS